MKIEQRHWTPAPGEWSEPGNNGPGIRATLVLAFGAPDIIADPRRYDELWGFYPSAEIVLCSTAGEIIGTNVHDDTIVATAIQFERSEVRTAFLPETGARDPYQGGMTLAGLLPTAALRHVLIFSDGQHINGSELVRGLNAGLPKTVTVTGGLAGDGNRFRRTLVGLNGVPTERGLVAVGLYGKRISVRQGSFGGWDSFGLDRCITRSEGNVLFELDGQPALDLYKRYLGDQAAGLPGTALLFPLSLRMREEDAPVVRTILSVNEEQRSMTFAGDMPEGAYTRLMKANFERLIDGSGQAAHHARTDAVLPASLALLISCVGRKLVLGPRVAEEVERVREVFGDGTTMAGFYSYGEISPQSGLSACELHNQTMTITTLSEEER
ncbi:MAG: FIST C-terminal domain-containing protein [Bacteroidetes bacterium]|nr:FIST C-terminal domain-containing protein [Bacteroidota bacterium]